MREFHRSEGLAERADLVDLDEDGVGTSFIDASLQKRRVGDEEIVSDQLGGLAQSLGDGAPPAPVVFRQTVLDRTDRPA